MSETDKTDKRAFVSNVSPQNRQIERFSSDHLRLLAGDDWPEINADPAQIAAFRWLAETAEQIQRGIVPEHYTARTTCRRCGPVPIFEGCPPRVEGCPWCFARRARREWEPHDDGPEAA